MPCSTHFQAGEEMQCVEEPCPADSQTHLGVCLCSAPQLKQESLFWAHFLSESNCNAHKAIKPNVPSFSRTTPPCTHLYHMPKVVYGICAGLKEQIAPQRRSKPLVLVDGIASLRACDMFFATFWEQACTRLCCCVKEPSWLLSL